MLADDSMVDISSAVTPWNRACARPALVENVRVIPVRSKRRRRGDQVSEGEQLLPSRRLPRLASTWTSARLRSAETADCHTTFAAGHRPPRANTPTLALPIPAAGRRPTADADRRLRGPPCLMNGAGIGGCPDLPQTDRYPPCVRVVEVIRD